MAEIYLLDMTPKYDGIRCAFHVPVSSGNNFAGISYRSALTQWLPTTASQVPYLDAAAQSSLDAGELYEHVETVYFSAADSNAAKWNKIRQRYTAAASGISQAIQGRLEFWGHSGNSV